MQRKTIAGVITPLKTQSQRELHGRLGEFAEWMERAKDAREVQKDKLKSVPVSMLPMVF